MRSGIYFNYAGCHDHNSKLHYNNRLKPNMKQESYKIKGLKTYFYYNAQMSKTLNELKGKYHLSWSTIIDILISKHKFYGMNLNVKYLFPKTDDVKITTIKPRLIEFEKTKPSEYAKIISNIVHIWTNSDWKELYNNVDVKKTFDKNKETQKYISACKNEMQNRQDQFYDYNDRARDFTRFIKHNKSYVERLMKKV